MNKRKVAAGVVLASLVSAALAACSGSGSASGDASGAPLVLSELDYQVDEPSSSQMKETLDGCAEQVGVTIDRQTVPGGQLVARVLQAAQSKTMPDLVRIDNPDMQQIAATGGLAPLGDYGITGEGTAQGILDASTYEGQLYGLQPMANTLGMFYNKDLLDAAGVDVPTTWAELETAAAAVSHDDVYGFATAGALGGEAWGFLPFMWTNGGDESDLTSPEVAAALQLFVDLEDNGGMSQSVVNWTQSDVTDQFLAGKAALMVNGSWNMGRLADEADFTWGVAELPVNEPGQVATLPFGGEAWTVPVTGDEAKQAKAAEMVKCLTSDDSELAQAQRARDIPAKVAVADEFVKDDPDMAPFASAIANGRARTGQLGPDWPAAAEVIYQGLQLALTGQASPADAMAQAAQS